MTILLQTECYTLFSNHLQYDFYRGKGGDGTFVLYLHALSMTNDRNKEKGGGGAASKTAIGSDLGIEFSRADYDMINEIHSFESQIFKLLVHSLCPAIYGHEVVKAGLLLALFGGEC